MSLQAFTFISLGLLIVLIYGTTRAQNGHHKCPLHYELVGLHIVSVIAVLAALTAKDGGWNFVIILEALILAHSGPRLHYWVVFNFWPNSRLRQQLARTVEGGEDASI